MSGQDDYWNAGQELYFKMKLLRIMDDKITKLDARRSELHKECIKLFEKNFKGKGDK
jgi:hypothetical protein